MGRTGIEFATAGSAVGLATDCAMRPAYLSRIQTAWIQIRPYIPDLGPNCLQRLSADKKINSPLQAKSFEGLFLREQSYLRTFEPRHEISNNVVGATSKASDQPVHTPRLIRAFASRLNIL